LKKVIGGVVIDASVCAVGFTTAPRALDHALPLNLFEAILTLEVQCVLHPEHFEAI